MGELTRMAPEYRPEVQIPLLNGRLIAGLPRGAAVQPPTSPIPPGQETQVLLTRGDERMALVATELYAYSPGGFRETVERLAGRWGSPGGSELRVVDVPVRPSPGFRAVAVLRSPLDTGSSAVPVADAFVHHPDTTVQRVSVQVSPEAAADPDGCAQLALRTLRELSAGPVALSWSPGPRLLPDPWGGTGLAVHAPGGWVAVAERGPDFVRHTLRRVLPFDGPFANVSFYVGGHPAPRHTGEPGAVTGRAPGALLGARTEWFELCSREPSRATVYGREALVGFGGSLLHASCATDDPDLSREMETILASLEPVPAR